jgi:site-specific recombinase XerD
MGLSKRQQKGAPVPPRQKPLSLAEALAVFLHSHHAAGHSAETSKDYKTVIGLFLDYIAVTFYHTQINQVTEANVLEWLSHLRSTPSRLGRPFSSRSIQTYFRDVCVFFNWLHKHKHIKVNPIADIEGFKVERAMIRVFTEEELERLDTACERPEKGRSVTPDERKTLAARDRAFLWLLLSTGIRVSEACGLLFSDIEWGNGMIYVRGKGAKERKVPMGKVAKQHLMTYIRYWRGEPDSGDEHVFLNVSGRPLGRRGAGEIFKRLKREAGITDKRVSPHTCRHWFAVNAIKKGVPSTVVQEWLGHENLDMIKVYVRLAEQDHREIYDQFSPVDSLPMHRTPKNRRKQLQEWRSARKKGSRKEDASD